MTGNLLLSWGVGQREDHPAQLHLHHRHRQRRGHPAGRGEHRRPLAPGAGPVPPGAAGLCVPGLNLLDTLTLEENIGLALSLNHTDPGTVQRRVREMAARLEIMDVLEKFPYQVSGGQKQRAACARAMVAGQSLLLADEPTGALDSKASKNLLEIMTRMNRDMGATIRHGDHDAYSASYAARVLFLKDGRLFHELLRGERGRPVFYHEVLDVLALLGVMSVTLYKLSWRTPGGRHGTIWCISSPL